jgi:hypothetical protein
VCRSPAEYVAPAEEYATDHGSCHPETGDLPAATDPDELVRTLIAPIHMRFLITAEPIDEATADNAARVALAAALSSATAWGPVSGPRPGISVGWRAFDKVASAVVDAASLRQAPYNSIGGDWLRLR